MGIAAITMEISRLISVRKKLLAGDYVTLREETDISLILGIPKFRDKKEMANRIDGFFIWLSEALKTVS